MHIRLHTLGLLVVAGLLLTVPPAVAQVAPTLDATSLRSQLMQQAQRQAAQRAISGVELTLEGALDADLYVVGPGDEFVITTGGSLAEEYRTIVSAEGMLLVPEAGQFEVAGLTLREAKGLVKESLLRLYSNVPAEVALAQPRKFYVHVTGAVRLPGRHVVGPVARLEDAVVQAMDGENPLMVFRMEYLMAQRRSQTGTALPALRNIEVRHQDGTVSRIDLRRYYASGDHDANPYLRDGDVVHVPLFDLRRSAVYVEGGGTVAGAYDLRPDETAATLLAAAAGTADLTEIGPVRVVSSDGRTSYLISPTANPGTTMDLAGINLRAGDRIIIQRAAPKSGVAEISGRALFPGTYPIVNGETTARDLLDQAGGVLDDALRTAVYVDRPGPAHDDQIARDPAFQNDLAGIPGAVMREPTEFEIELALEDESFRSLRLADLAFAERQYMMRELRGYSRIMLDLDTRDGSDLVLYDGDILVIPEDPGGVVVAGQVISGGVVAHAPGRNAGYYVDSVGGPTDGAANTYVLRAGSGQLIPENLASDIRHGDMVIVTRRQLADSDRIEQLRIQERQMRLQNRQQFITVGTAILSTATSLLIALVLR